MVDRSPPCDLVIFGGTGDLAMRKLYPALYQLKRGGQLHAQTRILAVARREFTDADFRVSVDERSRKHVKPGDFEAQSWNEFLTLVDYCAMDAGKGEGYDNLAQRLSESGRTRVFYLSTGPGLFAPICQGLAAAGLVDGESRVVLEKPLGHDLASARAINDAVGKVFDERQIFRIDHYLGKETVQNLMALRFGNVLFEPIWKRGWISHVQITVAEQIGVEGRGDFYDGTGAMRDMVQNHLLQLLCIMAMEPPISGDPDAIRDEKLKVLRALKPITASDVAACTVRGQYRAGATPAGPVPAYLDEPGIRPGSSTETFVALRAELSSWRWAGVPFFLRTGKRMPEKLCEIVVHFREVPLPLFPAAKGVPEANRLVMRLQPEEWVKLSLMVKAPGEEMQLRPVNLNLDFSTAFRARKLEAYERLLLDVLRGRLTLFMRRDELESAWRWVEPMLQVWSESDEPPRPYTAGTWGPAAASALISRDGFTWHEEL